MQISTQISVKIRQHMQTPSTHKASSDVSPPIAEGIAPVNRVLNRYLRGSVKVQKVGKHKKNTYRSVRAVNLPMSEGIEPAIRGSLKDLNKVHKQTK